MTGRRTQAMLVTLALTLAACEEQITPAPPAATPPAPAPVAPAAPEPAEPEPTCEDSAIRLVDRGQGIHGAIVDDMLHLGGETAPAECRGASSAARTLTGDDPAPAAQTQEAPDYFLLVVKYETGNRLYVVRTQADGTACIVDTHDRCIVQVTVLPDGFDLSDLPADVPPTIPDGQAEAPAEATSGPIPNVAGIYRGNGILVSTAQEAHPAVIASPVDESRGVWLVDQDGAKVYLSLSTASNSGKRNHYSLWILNFLWNNLKADSADSREYKPVYYNPAFGGGKRFIPCSLSPDGECRPEVVTECDTTFCDPSLRDGWASFTFDGDVLKLRATSSTAALTGTYRRVRPTASDVSNISPADGATGVAVGSKYWDTMLRWEWNGHPVPWLFKLCISTSSRALSASTCQQSLISPAWRDFYDMRDWYDWDARGWFPLGEVLTREIPVGPLPYHGYYSTTYYWGLVVRDDDGVDHTYGPWSFTTEDQPEEPSAGWVSNISPADGATDVSVGSDAYPADDSTMWLEWTWSAPLWRAKVCISATRALSASRCHPPDSDLLRLFPNDPNTPWGVSFGKLRYSTTYYWYLVVRGDDGVDHTYGPWSFTTEGQQRAGVLDVGRNPQSATSVGLLKPAVSITPGRVDGEMGR